MRSDFTDTLQEFVKDHLQVSSSEHASPPYQGAMERVARSRSGESRVVHVETRRRGSQDSLYRPLDEPHTPLRIRTRQPIPVVQFTSCEFVIIANTKKRSLI